MQNIEKRLGILGGMGPEATLLFYKYVLQFSGAENDQDHLEAIIAMLPHIPDRTNAIIGNGEDPTNFIVDGLHLLANAGADFAVITCNTAHYFLPKIIDSIPIPVLNMIQLTAAEISSMGLTKAGLLATDGTIKSGLYKHYLEQQNIALLTPSCTVQNNVTDIIYGKKGIKAGFTNEENRSRLLACASHLFKRGAEVVILGCTELPLVLITDDYKQSLIDPLSVLAQETIKIAKGDKCLDQISKNN